MPKFLEASNPELARAAINVDLYVNAKDFGVVGDGSTDDTVALQAWLDEVVSTNAQGWLPNGTYKITSTLTAAAAPSGYSLCGEHRNRTLIVQHTNNVPVMQIGDSSDSTRGITIDNIGFTYNAAQPSSNTNANCLVFTGPGGTATTTAYGHLRRLTFSKGYYALRVPSGEVPLWATEFDNLYMQSMSGGFYDCTGCVGGAPNNKWGRLTLYCDDAVGPIFKAWSTNSTTVDAIEFLRANANQTLISTTAGFSADIGTIKLETATYTTAKNLVELGASFRIRIGYFEVLSGDFNPTSGNVVAFKVISGSTPTTSSLDVGVVNLRATTLSGTCVGFETASGSFPKITVGNAELQDGWQLQFRSGSNVGNLIIVDSWVNGRLSSNKGDNDYTVTLSDPNIVHFATPFTAQRTITLPDAFTNNACAGLYYDLIFDGAINGANTAVIKRGSTTLRTQTVDKKRLRYMWRRTEWVLVDVCDLNAGSTSAQFLMGTIELGHASDTTISRASAGQLAVEGNPLGTKVAVPASAGATGVVGQWAAESGWLYICVAANTWERVAIATW